MSNLTIEQRRELYRRYDEGEDVAILRVEYGLNNQQVYRLRHRERLNAEKRQWIAANPQLHRDRTNASKRKNWDEYLERNNVKNRKSRRQLRERVVETLGGRCAHCGYNTDSRALQIDHLNGDGAAARKLSNYQYGLYKEIVEHGSQGKYQLLCANCNVIKRMENKEHPKGPSRWT